MRHVPEALQRPAVDPTAGQSESCEHALPTQSPPLAVEPGGQPPFDEKKKLEESGVARLQARQVPVQLLSQHRPSRHVPFSQSVSLLQASPRRAFWQPTRPAIRVTVLVPPSQSTMYAPSN